MTSPADDLGVIQTLLQRLNEFRLPRLLAVKQKVDAGETLADEDIDFLREVFEDANRAKPIIDRHPEYQDLVARAMHLYKEITDRAMENEKSR